MRPLRKVLISNRGEIAIRIARTCRKLGLKTVAIYSDLDRNSPHLDYCDESFYLGSGTIAETYLAIPKIIEALRKHNADAVHPGYGFLSERAPFVRAVQAEKAVFVGPQPESMEAMGDKIQAKLLMKKMGVPLLPGTEGGVSNFSDAKKAASKIGYPVLLKAAAGGGGKGMRIVRTESDLEAALESAAKEAQRYFGDGTVYIEKYLENPHHVEVQVLGDGHGGGGHVFDRECSIQRRHQKLVEESPAPLLNRHPVSKNKILEVATRVVEQMKYANAGTLEFLADDDGGFYFLEMNTRLQVEHPVTEWVTGLDLVEMQLRVAAGEALKKGPIVSSQNGHSIEVRIYAESPFDYLPSGGKIEGLVIPQGPFVRVDSSVYSDYVVPTDYDPTLMKLSVWGRDRAAAVAQLTSALDELRILGVTHNQGLFWAICREKNFKEGLYGTPYLERNRAELRCLYDEELARLKGFFRPLFHAAATTPVGSSELSTQATPSAWAVQARRESVRNDVWRNGS